MADSPGDVAPAAAPRPRWRSILCGALVVLGCLLAPISVHAVWLHSTLLDTDQYVATVGPLARNGAVQEAIANRVSGTVVDPSRVQVRLKEALPPAAAIAVPIIAKGASSFAHDLVLKIVQSSKFEQLWKSLNHHAHSRVVAVLRGEGRFVNGNGQVTIDIQPVIDRANSALQKVGLSGLSKSAGQSSHEIVLFSSSTLAQVQGAVRVFDDLAIALPILTVAAFAAAIAASGNRRRTVLRAGIGLAFGSLLFLVVWKVLRSPYQSALPRSVSRPAAVAIYDQLLSFLFLALRTVLAFGVVVAVGAWLAGPGAVATRIRATVRSALSRTPGQGAVPAGVAVFVHRCRNPLRAVAVAFGLLVLVLLNHPGPLSVLWIALVVLVLLGLIEVLGRAGATDVPSAEPSEAPASRAGQ